MKIYPKSFQPKLEFCKIDPCISKPVSNTRHALLQFAEGVFRSNLVPEKLEHLQNVVQLVVLGLVEQEEDQADDRDHKQKTL
jgi:hypothetical protein